jgi:glycosyltransferase involved in cell wall biosynthesis
MPLALPWQDRRTVQRALARVTSGRYDLVWFFGARPWVLSGEAVLAPTVLDLDDLEDQKIVARLSAARQSDAPLSNGRVPASGWVGRLRRTGSTVVAEEEIRRWRRLERRAAARVSAVAVCSELDAGRARANGVTGVVVVPNGYPPVPEPVGRSAVGSPPTVLFQGLLRYPPNIAAARFLADDIAPALRDLVPDARVRLVGDHHDDLSALDDPPRVSVVGRVPHITVELARADVVIVPLLSGSGTRVKILEAFAHRIPVVSTTLGAEGLGVRDGVHLLIADSATDLAGACGRLLTDAALRQELTAQAWTHFDAHFSGEVVESTVAELARRVADTAPD